MRGLHFSRGNLLRSTAGIASAAAAFILLMSHAAADDEDICAELPEDLYPTCALIISLENFSQSAEKKKRWEDARDYSSAAVHTIDYFSKKIQDGDAFASLRGKMAAKRAVLEKTRAAYEASIATSKEEEDRRDKVLLNFHISAPAPDVYVNGGKVTGPVYVTRDKIVLGLGQDGRHYDLATLPSVTSKSLDVQVTGAPRVPVANPAAIGTRSSGFDFSMGLILGARDLNGGAYHTPPTDWTAGLRSELTLPDLASDARWRLRPLIQYNFEQSGTSNTDWKVHSFGVGLKLTFGQMFDFGLSGGGAYLHDPKNDVSAVGGYGPEVSAAFSQTIVNNANTSGPKLRLGVGAAAGASYWAQLDAAPYFNAGVFLRMDFGRDQSSRAPSPSDMVHFKGGTFLMGSDDGDPSEKPEHLVLFGSFDLDITEVTVADYRVCVDAKKCSVPETTSTCNWGANGRWTHPVNCVTREQATEYCAFVGKRLPTESEWEYAARGVNRRKYPWGGEAPKTQPCWSGGNDRTTSTCEVGSHPDDKTPDGVLDLGGNVSEWTGQYCDYLKASCGNVRWVSRGGSYGHDDHEKSDPLRVTARYVPDQKALETVGFRCAR